MNNVHTYLLTSTEDLYRRLRSTEQWKVRRATGSRWLISVYSESDRWYCGGIVGSSTQLTTVVKTDSQVNITSSPGTRPTLWQLPQPPRPDDVPALNATVASLSSSSRSVMETHPSVSRLADLEMSSSSSRRITPTIKLGSYDGVAITLETHLSKLDNCASYYNWSARDRLCHLKASLESPAGQFLWEISTRCTSRLLRQ